MGGLVFITFRDKKNIGDLYGSINLLINGVLTIITNNWMFLLFGFIIGWFLRIGGYERSFSSVKFDVPDKVIGLSKLFDEMVNHVNVLSPLQSKEIFLNMGLMSVELPDIPSNLPEYEERFTLSIKTDDREDCLIEILGMGENIIQIGVQVYHRKIPLLNSNLNQHSFLVEKLFENFFGIGKSIDNPLGSDELIEYQGNDILGYTNKLDFEDHQSLIFRVGNKSFFKSMVL